MSEGHLWLYIANEEQVGPVNGEQLQQLAASAEIDPTTPVWTESLDEWTTADQIEGLFPDPVAVGGSRLITGSAAQTATPLAGAPVAAEPLDVAPVATAGFALGGSLASSPHAISPGLQPAQPTRFQIRSVGILQAGIVMALLMSITALLTLLVFMSFSSIIGGMAGGTDISGLFAIGGIMLVIVPIVYGIIGFIYGIFAALIYNLAAKMCGGLVLRVQTTQF